MAPLISWSALGGGALIGASASLLLLTHGRIAGVSGLLAGVLRPQPARERFRWWFVAGLALAGVAAGLWAPGAFGAPRLGIAATIVAGLLVGFGTRLGNGCTSGHGVCGISRLSPRSLVATVTFCATGALTVTLVRVLGLGS